ncbi:MAG: NADH-quinone oxidoreductase subunit NuoE [Brevefilum sp.]|nr:NADH-quinone oxidoreductase subunit NuoE [Brevefilum sp.]MDT8381095.1 NADH-quinone oxidoreductase subunit NuoE [Brevefilum sp.]MDW7754199.1 NADH-quinone oxidoreductase subunit NuoE [Brevefilum sp.]
MATEVKEGQDIRKLVRTLVQNHGDEKAELIPILHEINRELGYISDEAIKELSKRMNLPSSHIYSVATFYRMLSTEPRGRHVIQFCESAPCHVTGGRLVWQKLQRELGLPKGETSQDNKWTLLTTSCLGLCGVGPVMVIDNDIYGNVTPEQVPGILKNYE